MSPSRAADITRLGEAIYKRHKDELEKAHRGQYVAINVLNGMYATAPTCLEAIDKAKEVCGKPFEGYVCGIGFVEFFGNV